MITLIGQREKLQKGLVRSPCDNG